MPRFIMSRAITAIALLAAIAACDSSSPSGPGNEPGPAPVATAPVCSRPWSHLSRRPVPQIAIVVVHNGIGPADRDFDDWGFGPTLVRMLAKQLEAEIAQEDRQPGARVTIALPAAREA